MSYASPNPPSSPPGSCVSRMKNFLLTAAAAAAHSPVLTRESFSIITPVKWGTAVSPIDQQSGCLLRSVVLRSVVLTLQGISGLSININASDSSGVPMLLQAGVTGKTDLVLLDKQGEVQRVWRSKGRRSGMWVFTVADGQFFANGGRLNTGFLFYTLFFL